MATLELRPRTATEIIDASFQLLRVNYVALVTFSVAAQLPLLVFRLIFVRMPMGANATPAEVMQAFSTYFGLIILLAVLAVVAQNAVMVATSQLYLGEPMDAGKAVRRAAIRSVFLLLSYLLLAIPLFIGFLLFFIPGVYASLRLIALNTVVVLEDHGPWASVRRAWTLGGGHIGHMFVAVFLGACIYVGVALIGVGLVAVLAMAVPVVKDPNVNAIFSTAVAAIVYPLVIAIAVVLYYDLRIRHEGLDVEMMSKSLTT